MPGRPACREIAPTALSLNNYRLGLPAALTVVKFGLVWLRTPKSGRIPQYHCRPAHTNHSADETSVILIPDGLVACSDAVCHRGVGQRQPSWSNHFDQGRVIGSPASPARLLMPVNAARGLIL
jgi:hypothetical protein